MGNQNRISMLCGIFLFVGILAPCRSEAETSSQILSYALVVGSNRPGQGQSPLSFAKNDAERFREVLIELGGMMPGHVSTLYDPTVAELEDAIGNFTDRISQHARAGEKTNFVFYYSGHARATAINLGETELKLKSLRGLLEGIPADVKLVVLDACQTGAISTVKGIEPAADFSFNSVNGLRVEGMAVLASSAADELSQESERLEGSFFTHHLVAGLRGAADVDSDGRITLGEAYQYTYNRTLVDTAKTAVGKQHVTFETELSGEGEMVLTWPSGAAAWLTLPEGLQGEILVYRASGKKVMAEVHKTGRDAMRLALTEGGYRALVRQGDRAYDCDMTLTDGKASTLDLQSCKEVSLDAYNAKGKNARREHLFFEIGFGMLFKWRDSYTERLENFGYSDSEVFSSTSVNWRFSAFAGVLRYLQIGLEFGRLDDGAYESAGGDKRFEWTAYRLGVLVRGRLPLLQDRLIPFAQAGAGLAFGATTLTDGRETEETFKERFFRYHVSGSIGLQVMPWRHIGFFVQGDYYFAPVIENLIGDTHDSGGIAVATGLRGGF